MHDLIGLIPAAGQAYRLGLMPCSKEIFPLGVMENKIDDVLKYRPKPVGLYLIERMILAGVERILMIINRDKWDIVQYFGNGSNFGVSISYLIQENLVGLPSALNTAYPWISSDTVLFGMPDTIFQPIESFQILLAKHRETNADVTLGLYPTQKPEKFGMVSFDNDYWMKYTIDKPAKTNLKYLWGIGCWGPVFTEFMNKRISQFSPSQKENVLGDIFQDAVEAGLRIKVVPFDTGEYTDIGSLDDLVDMIRKNS